VGETLAIAATLREIMAAHPHYAVLVTSTTPTGAAQVQRLFADTVIAGWAPFDTPGAVTRFLRHYQPRLAVMVETEIWPNIVRLSQGFCPVILANARLSKRSARGYARMLPLSLPTLRGFACIAAQSRDDARRFQALGVVASRLHVTGSIKFDLDTPALESTRLVLQRELQLPRPQDEGVVIVASTHEGEEECLLDALADTMRAFPRWLWIFAPRHPVRGGEVSASLQRRGFANSLRSTIGTEGIASSCLVLDSLGELSALFGVADLAIIGGSFVPRGGHNPIEAMHWGVATITGPHTFNFARIYQDFCREGAVLMAATPSACANELARLLTDAKARQALGQRGQAVLSRHQGAQGRLLALIDAYLSS
jgi:3-deoxy-D-manno-octulosonic-acid transferase